MADLKISQLTDGGAAQATDEYVVARSGDNRRIDGTEVAAAATKLGTIGTGVWQGTAVANAYIASGLDVAKLTTGTTLPANVVNSSLTSVGTLTTLNATTITEATVPVVVRTDIGSAPNEIPLNQYLGAMAYVDTPFATIAQGGGISGTNTRYGGSYAVEGTFRRISIVLDIRSLNSGGTAGDIIGLNGTALPCFIGQIPSVTILGGRMTCLEAPTGGDTDFDLYSAVEGTGVEDAAISGLTATQLVDAGGAWTAGTVKVLTANPAIGSYLYLVGQGTANATYTAGRFLIELFGV